MKKNIIFITIIILITVIFLLTSRQGASQRSEVKPSPPPSLKSPKIISTKPDLSAETIISATQTIELIFNRPLENVPELKLRLEPKTDYQVELSFDRQTALIIPIKPFELGTAYTLTILKDSKFDGGGRLDQDLVFHFRTVRYRGI